MRALLSVTDKTGIVEFGQGLHELGYSLLSTGGTYRVLREGGVPVQEVAEYTGSPEMMDGRVKTLHPKVHGGILARRALEADLAAMKEHGIDAIDVVVVNLYAFGDTVRNRSSTRETIVENIDIGGPSMVRSAAKNHAAVTVVTEPADYDDVLAVLRTADGERSEALRRRLAAKAFAHTAAYDAAVASWFAAEQRGATDCQPNRVSVAGTKLQDLRYGENPHQSAAFYRAVDAQGPSLANAKQICGKELSFNNLLDLDAALGLALEFDESSACVIVKHGNPCGASIAPDQQVAFDHALGGDPLSAFGGIHAYNRPLTASTAQAIVASGTFVEAIVAPGIEDGVLEALAQAKWGKSVRVLDTGGLPDRKMQPLAVRQISGGFLVQDADAPPPLANLDVVTERAPSDAEHAALRFAWSVAKHVKSNAIVFAIEALPDVFAVVGVGAGQMSRVDAVHLASLKSDGRSAGAVMASDAFFPFADGVEAALKVGIKAVIQPGGSKRDPEVVAAVQRADASMVFTGRRHFRH